MNEWNIKSEVGDVIYPDLNGTLPFWKQSRWDIVMQVNKKGYPIELKHFYNYEAIQIYQTLVDVFKVIK